MNAKTLIRRVRELALPICAEAGVALWDVTFEKEGRDTVLTVLIDRDEGVDIDDCERVSRAIDPLLDAPEFDSLPSYVLSVSSAGLERTLRTEEHFAWAVGRTVDVGFYRAVGGAASLTGVLCARDAEALTLRVGEEERRVPLSDAAWVRLHFEA